MKFNRLFTKAMFMTIAVTSLCVSIACSESEADATEVARYDIYGRLLTEPTPGINIVIYSDGTSKKIIID